MRSDDQLLKALGQLAREQEEEKMRLDPRWEALSHGELDGEGEADLVSLAQSSPQMKAAWEAFRPLDRSFRRSILDHIQGIFPNRRRPSRPATAAGWALAAAASLTMVLVGSRFLSPGQPPIPEYSLEIGGGAAAQRSGQEPQGIPRLMEGVRLDLVLFPAGPVAGDVVPAVFVQQGGTVRPWRVPAERVLAAPTGSLKLELRARDLPLDPGPATLWLAVSRPCCRPGIEEVRGLLRQGGQGEAGAVRWIRQEIVLAPPSASSSPRDVGLSEHSGHAAGSPSSP